jgi:hypothetical protein
VSSIENHESGTTNQETGNWKQNSVSSVEYREPRIRKLETGNWKLETELSIESRVSGSGNWNLETGDCDTLTIEYHEVDGE